MWEKRLPALPTNYRNTSTSLNTTRRTVRFTVGWTITDTDEAAIAALPKTAWTSSTHQDSTVDPDADTAELTGLNQRTG